MVPTVKKKIMTMYPSVCQAEIPVEEGSPNTGFFTVEPHNIIHLFYLVL